MTSIRDNGREMLASPIRPTVWRAPTDNDKAIAVQWEKAGYRTAQSNCGEFSWRKSERGVSATVVLTMASIPKCPFLKLAVTYTILPTGVLEISCHGERQNYCFRCESPFLPRFGFEFTMPEDNEKLSYFGRGPVESYEDKRLASRMGLYSTTVSKHFEHYVRPQENMAHTDTEWVKVTNLQGHGLLVSRAENAFSFNCSHFTPERLTATPHNYELPPMKETVVNIDYRQSGIGSNSCGPELKKKYRIDEPEFDFAFRLSPA